MTRVSRIALPFAVAVALALPAAASAAPTAGVSGGVVSYLGGAESSSLSITLRGGSIVFGESTAGVVAGGGCQANGARSVACPMAGVTSVTVDLGDGDDVADATDAIPVPVTWHGGRGSDTLSGGPGPDSLSGDTGNDVLDGGPGDDLLDGGVGVDSLSGGAGVDGVTYASRSSGVVVTLDGAANDGEPGENDFVAVENVTGSAGRDTLTGDGSANRLNGLAGADTLTGGAGDDALDGGLNGDSLDGGAGADAFAVRDDTRDTVSCGSQPDSVVADRSDAVDADCESVDLPHVEPPAGAAPPVQVVAPPVQVVAPPVQVVAPPAVGNTGPDLAGPPAVDLLLPSAQATAGGMVGVSLACPASAASDCNGSVVLKMVNPDAGATDRRQIRVSGVGSFAIPAGKSQTVQVRLRRGTRRMLNAHGRLFLNAVVRLRRSDGTVARGAHPITVHAARRGGRKKKPPTKRR